MIQSVPSWLARVDRLAVRRVVAGLLWIAAIAGYVLLGLTLASREIDEHGETGSAAADAFAYWLAGRRLLAGEPVYGGFAGMHGAFLYPPLLAQLAAPLSLFPLAVFVWGWRAIELLALRWIVRSWRNAGIALLVFPALLGEIEAGNVNLLIAAAIAGLLRGDARAVGPAALSKFAALAAVPAAWAIDRRGLLWGLLVAALLVLGSVAAAPGLWREYATFLPTLTDPVDQFYNVGRLVPTPLRLAAALVLAIAAHRWPILTPTAVTLATPVLWFHNLSILVATVVPVIDRAPRGRVRPPESSH